MSPLLNLHSLIIKKRFNSDEGCEITHYTIRICIIKAVASLQQYFDMVSTHIRSQHPSDQAYRVSAGKVSFQNEVQLHEV